MSRLAAEFAASLPRKSAPLSTDLLTPDEVAKRLGLSRSGVYKLAQRKVLPGVKVGSRLRFRPEDVEAYLNGDRPDVDEVLKLAREGRSSGD